MVWSHAVRRHGQSGRNIQMAINVGAITDMAFCWRSC
jgi:hypothetical protein